MIKHTRATALTLALLLCGSLSQIQAADTKLTVKDSGSILIRADGLDAAKNWKPSPSELRHLNAKGILSGLQITERGADRCASHPTCGIDPMKPWTIRVIYNARWVTISSVSANKGVHVKFSPGIPFTRWVKTANTDEREFDHRGGHYISSIKVNGAARSLCAGTGGCQIVLTYTAP